MGSSKPIFSWPLQLLKSNSWSLSKRTMDYGTGLAEVPLTSNLFKASKFASSSGKFWIFGQSMIIRDSRDLNKHRLFGRLSNLKQFLKYKWFSFILQEKISGTLFKFEQHENPCSSRHSEWMLLGRLFRLLQESKRSVDFRYKRSQEESSRLKQKQRTNW